MGYIGLTVKKSKLIEILTTFSPAEMKSFEKFVASPYFSRGRDVSGLFSKLKKHYPGFTEIDVEKRNIFSALFTGENYNEKKLKNLSFELAHMAEQFLIVESIRKNDAEQEILLSIQYKDRGKRKLFANTLKLLEDRVNKKLFDSFNAFSTEEKLQWLKQEYFMGLNDYSSVIFNKGKHTEYILLSFLIKYLRALRDREVINSGFTGETNNFFLDTISTGIDLEKIILNFKKGNYSYLWLIEMYYYAYLSAKNLNDEKTYQKFRKIYNQNADKFSQREKYYMLSDFLSFCIRNHNVGKTNYRKEEMELYKIMMEQNAYRASEDEYLDIILYRNILFLATDLDEKAWYSENMNKLLEKLKPEFIENTRFYSIAHIEYKNNNFEKALEYISRVKYDVFFYKIDVKNLLLKIYYELKLYDQAFSMVDTYRHFLKNNKELAGEYKKQFINFISIYNKLLRASTGRNGNGNAGYISKALNDMDNVANRDWLINKISNLSKTK